MKWSLWTKSSFSKHIKESLQFKVRTTLRRFFTTSKVELSFKSCLFLNASLCPAAAKQVFFRATWLCWLSGHKLLCLSVTSLKDISYLLNYRFKICLDKLKLLWTFSTEMSIWKCIEIHLMMFCRLLDAGFSYNELGFVLLALSCWANMQLFMGPIKVGPPTWISHDSSGFMTGTLFHCWPRIKFSASTPVEMQWYYAAVVVVVGKISSWKESRFVQN